MCIIRLVSYFKCVQHSKQKTSNKGMHIKNESGMKQDAV